MRALPAILLFGTVFCNAQDVAHHDEVVSDSKLSASSTQLTAAVHPLLEVTGISSSSAEPSLAPNVGVTPVLAAPVQPVQPILAIKTETSFKGKRIWWTLT